MLTMLMGLALAMLAVGLAARAVALPRIRSAQRVAQIEAYGFAGAVIGPERVAAIQRTLLGAGIYNLTPERFLGLWAICAIGVPLLCVYLVVSAGPPAFVAASEIGIGTACGVALPWVMISRRARLRLEAIDYDMPELVDLLVVGVEAGMGFSAALRSACARIDGPLGAELRLMLQEQGLGASTSQALLNLLNRCETPATRSFVRTIVQGERLGVSIGTMMRALADEMRKRRRAVAEERAHKAPIKMLFPLVLLIFPSMFIVLLTPAAITLIEGFKHA